MKHPGGTSTIVIPLKLCSTGFQSAFLVIGATVGEAGVAVGAAGVGLQAATNKISSTTGKHLNIERLKKGDEIRAMSGNL